MGLVAFSALLFVWALWDMRSLNAELGGSGDAPVDLYKEVTLTTQARVAPSCCLVLPLSAAMRCACTLPLRCLIRPLLSFALRSLPRRSASCG
jgi:hypothetical protein